MSTGPTAAAVAKKRTIVSGESHAGRPGTMYRRAEAYTPAAPSDGRRDGEHRGDHGDRGARRRTPRGTATSRLSHERRRLRSAFHATAGRPRWNRAPTSPAPARAAASARSARRAGGGADPDRELAEQRQPHERPVRVLRAQVPVAGRVGVGREVVGQHDARRRQREVGARQLRRVAGRVVGPPRLDVDLLDGDGVGRAGATQAGARPSSSRGRHMSHLVTIRRSGWNAGHRVRAVPRAVLAADALVGVVGDDPVGELLVGVGRAALEAGRLEAVVARHRQVEAAGDRVVAALDLTDPPPRRARRQAVLLGAGDLARVAADAGVHGEREAVLLAGVERQQLGPGFGDAVQPALGGVGVSSTGNGDEAHVGRPARGSRRRRP